MILSRSTYLRPELSPNWFLHMIILCITNISSSSCGSHGKQTQNAVCVRLH